MPPAMREERHYDFLSVSRIPNRFPLEHVRVLIKGVVAVELN